MKNKTEFSTQVLNIDTDKEIERISSAIRTILSSRLKRRGLVVALSGGIDSSVTVALAARAVGAERVMALLMPERQSSPDTLELSRRVAECCHVSYQHEDISGILDAVGFYRRYDDAVRQVIPDYGEGWKSKIVFQTYWKAKASTCSQSWRRILKVGKTKNGCRSMRIWQSLPQPISSSVFAR